MTIINLPEGTHTIKWTLSGYNDLTAQIKISSTGQVTCISVSNGSCGGYSVPRVSISGSTVTGYMKSGATTPTPTPTITPSPSPGKVYVTKLAKDYDEIKLPFKLQHSNDENVEYLYAPDGSGHSSGAFARYKIYIPKSDTYKIVGRIFASSYSYNSFFIQYDNDQEIIWDIKTSGNWRWRNVSERGFGTELVPEHPIYTKYLTQGNHDFIIWHREIKTRITQFTITNDMNYLVGPSPTPAPTITPTPSPSNTFNGWLTSKGGDTGLLNNLSALLEIIDGYLGFTNLGFTVTLTNLLYVVDGYLGF